MEKIDLTDCEASLERCIQSDHPEFHMYMEEKGIYPHSILRKRSGLNDGILEDTPFGTFIVNVGGGMEEPFEREALAEKNCELITLDHHPGFLKNTRDASDWKVALDLRNIPDSLSNGPLRIQLERYAKVSRVEEVRTNVRLLAGMFARKDVGTYMFNQVLLYLPTEITKRLLNVCMHNLAPNGQIIITDRIPFQLEDMDTIVAGRSPGFDEAKEIAEEIGGMSLDEFFCVPIVSEEGYARLHEKVAETGEVDPCLCELFSAPADTIHFERWEMSLAMLLARKDQRHGVGKVAFVTLAQRVLKLRKAAQSHASE